MDLLIFLLRCRCSYLEDTRWIWSSIGMDSLYGLYAVKGAKVVVKNHGEECFGV